MENPQIDDVVHIKADVKSAYVGKYGVVSEVRSRRSEWTTVELVIGGDRLWLDREVVAYKKRGQMARVIRLGLLSFTNR